MAQNEQAKKPERRGYASPRLERLGSFEELTRTSGQNQVQADQVDYPNTPTVS
jgi:hypothetical protein